MGLGRFLSGIARTAVDVALLPVEVVKDIAACGAPGQTNTGKRLDAIVEDLDELPERIDE